MNIDSASSSDSEDEIQNIVESVVASAAAFTAIITLSRKQRRKNPSIWVNPYLKKRQTKGRFYTDFSDMRANLNTFKDYFHMTPTDYDVLFLLLEPLLQPKINSRPNDSISPKEKLAAVLEFLASGTHHCHMASIYRISKQHFGTILNEVCTAICEKFNIENTSEDEFVKSANDFNSIWDFPNCVGAIDGKHVGIKCPKNTGGSLYNYKDSHSIVLMAAVNAKYQFTFLDIVACRSEDEASDFTISKFGNSILEETLPFPQNMKVGDTKLPYFFVADDAFPLHTRIMKPYIPKKQQILTDEQQIFNYRLSRARRCVENAFGILCAKWICLRRKLLCGPNRAQKIISAVCYLHNYFIVHHIKTYCPPNFADTYDVNGNLIPGEWRKALPQDSMYHNNIIGSIEGLQNDSAEKIRDKLKQYVNSSAGSLSWQREAVLLD